MLTVRSEQLSDVVQVSATAGIVAQGLQLETDQAFGADDAQAAEGSVAGGGLAEQAEGDGPVGVKQVDAFVVAGIVRGVSATVGAVVVGRTWTGRA